MSKRQMPTPGLLCMMKYLSEGWMMMQRDVHLSPQDLLQAMQFKDGDFARTAVISGQPQRVSMAFEKLKNPMRNFSAFGYTFWTGEHRGTRVTVGNGGLYAPDAALVTELLCAGGVDCLIRLGSCGGLLEEIGIGDYVLAEGVLRGDGVTRYYVDDAFAPLADKGINHILQEGFQTVKRGLVWTTDAILKETKAFVNDAISKGAIAVDMVTSPFLTIAQIYQKRAAALLVVSDNVITGDLGFASIKVFDAEKKMIDRTFDLIETIDPR